MKEFVRPSPPRHSDLGPLHFEEYKFEIETIPTKVCRTLTPSRLYLHLTLLARGLSLTLALLRPILNSVPLRNPPAAGSNHLQPSIFTPLVDVTATSFCLVARL